MRRKRNHSIRLIAICILSVVGAATVRVQAQQGKVVSSYGPTNQDMSFDQIKAARMAVKAARAKENTEMLNSRYLLAKRSSAEIVMSGREAHPGRTDSQPPWSDVGAA